MLSVHANGAIEPQQQQQQQANAVLTRRIRCERGLKPQQQQQQAAFTPKAARLHTKSTHRRVPGAPSRRFWCERGLKQQQQQQG